MKGWMVQSKPPQTWSSTFWNTSAPQEWLFAALVSGMELMFSIFGCCAVSKPPKGFEFPGVPSLMTHSLSLRPEACASPAM